MTSTERGILAVTGGAVALFWNGAFILGFPGVMGAYWQEMFDVGRGAIGNTVLCVLVGCGISMILAGPLQEKFGAKKIMAAGAILGGLNVFTLVCVSNLVMLYLWAFIMGLAQCLIYVPALTIGQQWFPLRRGLVSGIVNLTIGMSAAIMSPVFGYMLNSIGYFPMIMVLGTSALVMGTLATQLTPRPDTIAEHHKQMAAQLDKPHILTDGSFAVRDALRTRSFWYLWVVWALEGAAGIAMVTLSVQFGLAMGFPLSSAVAILAGFNLSNGISRLLAGYLSDIVGRNLTMSISFFAAGAAYFGMSYAGGLVYIMALAVIIGFAFGTLFAVSAPLVTDCFGLTHFGSIFGLVFTAFGFLSGLLGPSFSGYILDATNGDFWLVFGYLGIFCVISGTLIMFVVPPGAAISRQG